MSTKLPSEKVVVSAPFSFVGSVERIWKIADSENIWIKWLLQVPIVSVLIGGAWLVVAVWYFVLYVLFGILFIPFRLWRRGVRKNKQNALRHREVLEAIRDNRAMAPQASGADKKFATVGRDRRVDLAKYTVRSNGRDIIDYESLRTEEPLLYKDVVASELEEERQDQEELDRL